MPHTRDSPAHRESGAILLPDRYRKLFLDTMNSDLAKIESALATHDARLALQVLHCMRGATMMMNLTTLSACVEAIEAKLARHGRDGRRFQEAFRLVLELRDVLDQI